MIVYEHLSNWELDMMVAEKVMGWTREQGYWKAGSVLTLFRVEDFAPQTERQFGFRPNADANDRDKVVGRMSELGYRGSLSWWEGARSRHYRAAFWRELEGPIFHCISDQPGRAVAIAALKAVEKEK